MYVEFGGSMRVLPGICADSLVESRGPLGCRVGGFRPCAWSLGDLSAACVASSQTWTRCLTLAMRMAETYAMGVFQIPVRMRRIPPKVTQKPWGQRVPWTACPPQTSPCVCDCALVETLNPMDLHSGNLSVGHFCKR